MFREDPVGMNRVDILLEELGDEGPNRPHHDLDLWKKSLGLVEEIYEATSNLPEHEKYGLRSQMRRSVTSVSSNIAEGAARGTQKEFAKFLDVAQGSNSELETQLVLCVQLEFIDFERAKELLGALNEISRMIVGLKKSLN